MQRLSRPRSSRRETGKRFTLRKERRNARHPRFLFYFTFWWLRSTSSPGRDAKAYGIHEPHVRRNSSLTSLAQTTKIDISPDNIVVKPAAPPARAQALFSVFPPILDRRLPAGSIQHTGVHVLFALYICLAGKINHVWPAKTVCTRLRFFVFVQTLPLLSKVPSLKVFHTLFCL